MADISIVYYTANALSEHFSQATQKVLLESAGGIPIISVSHKPMDLGSNIVVDLPRGLTSIYKQALIGAKAATTPYIALCEDDVLYSPEHFKHRPKPNTWSYNMNSWNLYTWGEPMFTYKPPGGRRGLYALICERELLIEHLEERFSLWPDEIDPRIFGEPGKYDSQLGTTPYPSEAFYITPPNVVFSHQSALGFGHLGTRKGVGKIRALEVPYWGRAADIVKLYQE